MVCICLDYDLHTYTCTLAYASQLSVCLSTKFEELNACICMFIHYKTNLLQRICLCNDVTMHAAIFTCVY